MAMQIENITKNAIEALVEEVVSKFDMMQNPQGFGGIGGGGGGGNNKDSNKSDNNKKTSGENKKDKNEKDKSAEDRGNQDQKEKNKDGEGEKTKNESDEKQKEKESKKKMLDDIKRNIEDLKKLAEKDKSIQDVIDKLEKAKDELEKEVGAAGDGDKKDEYHTKGNVEKKKYNPDLSSQSKGIDNTFIDNMTHDYEVSGNASNVKNFIKQFISSTDLDVAVFAEYLLDTVIKTGMAMNSMFDNFSDILSNPLPESKTVERSRSPIQAINIESFRQTGDDAPSAVVTNVIAKEHEPTYSHLVKSIVISFDTSGSMHSFFTEAIQNPARVINMYKNIVHDFDKLIKKTDLYKLIEENKFDFESKEHQSLIEKTIEMFKKEVGESNSNEFMTVLLLSMISRLDYISGSFDHFMGVINAAESPYGAMFGLPIIRRNNEGAYYLEFSMREALTDGDLSNSLEKTVLTRQDLGTKQMLYLKPYINSFMTYLSGGNESSYEVGYAWGVFFKTVMALSGLLNYYIQGSDVKPCDYSYCIGIMHVTDLYYETSSGFVSGFYSGISSRDMAKTYELTKFFAYGNKYSLFVIDQAYNKKVAQPDDMKENMVLPVEILQKLISNIERVEVEFKSGKLFIYVNENGKKILTSRVNVVFSDLSVFSFGDRTNDIKYFESEASSIFNLNHIYQLKEEDLKDIIQTKGFRSLLPNKVIVNQEDAYTIFSILLSSMLVRAKLVSDIQKDLSNISASDSFISKTIIEYLREVKKYILNSNRSIMKKILNNIKISNKPLILYYREDFDEISLLDAINNKNAYTNLIKSAFDSNVNIASSSSYGNKIEAPKLGNIGFIAGPAAF